MNNRVVEKFTESGFVNLGIWNQPDGVLSGVTVGVTVGEGVGFGVLVEKGVIVGKSVTVGRGVVVNIGAFDVLVQLAINTLIMETMKIIRLKSIQGNSRLKNHSD